MTNPSQSGPFLNTVEKVVLPNGITVFLDPAPQFRSGSVIIAAIGGSRSERPELSGVSHLLEHLLFKSTSRRSAKQIACEIDEFGGEVNAFTDSESLCLHGTVIRSRVPELLDFLIDLLTDPVITEEDLVIEKSIVRQEILEALDDTSDIISQEFRKVLWGGQALALPVFGTLESVSRLKLEHLREELRQLLSGRRLIVAVSGFGEERENTLKEIERRLGALPRGERPLFSAPFALPSLSSVPRQDKQTHLMIGWQWPNLRSEEYLAGMCLVSLLGHGVSSRLFQVLREEQGLCYDVGLTVDAYPDTACCGFTSVFEAKSFAEVVSLLKREINLVCREGVQEDEFQRATRLIRAQLEMEEDSPRGRLWRAVESETAHERLITTDEILHRLEKLKRSDLEKIARDYLSGPRYAVVGGKIPKKVEETLTW
jgi:predicted Zn-dependent peptidase